MTAIDSIPKEFLSQIRNSDSLYPGDSKKSYRIQLFKRQQFYSFKKRRSFG